MSWVTASNYLYEYICGLFDGDQRLSVVKDLSYWLRSAQEKHCDSSEDNCFDDWNLMPWQNIFTCIISHKIKHIPDHEVVYLSKDLKKFKVPQDWIDRYVRPLSTAARKRKKSDTAKESEIKYRYV